MFVFGASCTDDECTNLSSEVVLGKPRTGSDSNGMYILMFDVFYIDGAYTKLSSEVVLGILLCLQGVHAGSTAAITPAKIERSPRHT